MIQQGTHATFPQETAKAAIAFAAYVSLGPGRSLRALAYTLAEQNLYKNQASALASLNGWSSKYRWQDRLAAAVTEKTERLLAQAAELDAASYKRTSELLAERLALTGAIDTDHVVKIRESVRRPAPKGNTAGIGVNVQVSVSLHDLAERVAAEEGLDAAEVVEWADRYLREGV